MLGLWPRRVGEWIGEGGYIETDGDRIRGVSYAQRGILYAFPSIYVRRNEIMVFSE